MERQRARRPSRPMLVVVIVLTIALLTTFGLYHVWTSYQLVRLGYDLSAATREYKALLEQNQRLQLEFAALKRDALRKRQLQAPQRLRPPTALEMYVIPAGPEPPPNLAPQMAPAATGPTAEAPAP